MYDMQKRPIDLYPFEIVYLLPSGAEIKKYLSMYMLSHSSSLKLLSLHPLKKLTYVKFYLYHLLKGVGISLAEVKMKYI